MTKKALPDVVFTLAGLPDPFVSGNPYLRALLQLPPKERKVVVRQATLLMAAVQGLEPVEALELLARLGIWLNGQRAAVLQEDYDLRKFREDNTNGRKKTR